MEKKINNLIMDLDTSSDKKAASIIKKLEGFGSIAIPQLISSANNKSLPKIRKWSLQALGAIGEKEGVGPLLSALEDERMTIRLHAIHGLKRMKYKPAEMKLITLLKDSSGGIRVNTIDALIEIKSTKADSKLLKCLDDSSWYVRQHAAIACGKLNIKKAKGKLNKLILTDPRKAVREASKAALEFI